MLKFCLAIIAGVGLLMSVGDSKAITYNIDTNHSTVGFATPILGGLSKVRGKFTDFAVTINHDESDMSRSSVTAKIKATSIDTGIEKRDEHLRTSDFFDVTKFPEINFQSKRVEKHGKAFVAIGDFTMHGVTKEIALPFTITGKHVGKDDKTGEKLVNTGYSIRWKLNRQDYGISWRHSVDPNFIGDEIEIEINLITKATVVK